MNPDLFRNSTSGRLVETRIHLVPYQAFVPNPLPPEITPDWNLTRLISEADRAISELAGLSRSIPDPSILIEPFMRREAVLSSRIEGTHTEIEELYSFESGHQLPGYAQSDVAQKENQEVYNYVTALKTGIASIAEKPLDLDLLKEMNKLLLSGVRGDEYSPGKFRDVQNFIGPTKDPADAVFIPLPVEELAGALRQLMSYLNVEDKYPPLVRIGLIHYQFETIHPFIDGNGRVGRLLFVLLLSAWQLLPSPLLYLSAYFEKNREEYYQQLLSVSQNGSWESWLTYFLNAVIAQSKDAVSRSRGLIDLRERWRAQLNEAKTSSNYYTILDKLFISPYISVSDIEKLLRVTNKAARTMVVRMENMGILFLPEDVKYGRIYEARGIIEILRSI